LATLGELDTTYSLLDLLDLHDVMDLQDEADRMASMKMKSAGKK